MVRRVSPGPDFKGKVAVVTGGASRLASGVVSRLVERGGSVVLADVDGERLADAASRIPAGQVHAVVADVTVSADVQRVMVEACERFGRIDTLLVFAGLADRLTAARADLDLMDRAFDTVMAVNVKGALLATLAAAPSLREVRGSVVVTLSTAALMPGSPTGALYTIAKHAAVGLVRELALALAPDIRVNGVVPGVVEGARVKTLSTADREVPDAEGPPVVLATPLGRVPSPDEYAGIYLLLASPDGGANATGSIISWDGGISLVGHAPAIRFPGGQ